MKKRRLRKIFIAEAYRTYGNLSRFFIRVFAGIMFLQFGIRQVANYDFFAQYFPSMFGMSSETTLLCMITIELVFSILLIFGFLTRLSTIPPMISMIVAEYYIVAKGTSYGLSVYDHIVLDASTVTEGAIIYQ